MGFRREGQPETDLRIISIAKAFSDYFNGMKGKSFCFKCAKGMLFVKTESLDLLGFLQFYTLQELFNMRVHPVKIVKTLIQPKAIHGVLLFN
jgi:hypothetical protein